MTWTPTAGMLKAESIVQTMLTDATTRHVFITDPILRHRWVQTIADALDGFQRNDGVAEFLEERDDDHLVLRENGYGWPHQAVNTVETQPSVVDVRVPPSADVPTGAEPKRRAGRPKGAKNKRKAKAAKAPVEPVEAAAT